VSLSVRCPACGWSAVVTNPEGEAPALCPACDVPMVRVIDTGPGWGGVVERHDEQAARLDRIRRDALRRLKRAEQIADHVAGSDDMPKIIDERAKLTDEQWAELERRTAEREQQIIRDRIMGRFPAPLPKGHVFFRKDAFSLMFGALPLADPLKPWELTAEDARYLRAIRIDPEVPA
jgi:hypothetical protein